MIRQHKEVVSREEQMRKLISVMRKDQSIETILTLRKGVETNVGLINQFKHHEVIPNKWFDWERSANAEVMVIGQDWGPYKALEKMISDFDLGRTGDEKYYREYLFRDFSSRTEKFILKTITGTYLTRFGQEFTLDKWDKIMFTMAVLFTRQGKHFRGSEFFDMPKSFERSYKYVKKQLDIVQPKLIITLGNLGFEVVNRYFNLGYSKVSISKVTKELDGKFFIESGGTMILPNYHPAAHVDPKIQYRIWEKMWDVVSF